MDALFKQRDAILSELGALEPSPACDHPYEQIVKMLAAAESDADEVSEVLSQLEQEHDAQHPGDDPRPSRRRNPYTERRYRISRLRSELGVTGGRGS